MVNNQMLYQTLDILSDNDVIDKQMPQSITQNLNPNYPLRPYQVEAFARFIHCYHKGISGNPLPRPHTCFLIWQLVAVRRLLWRV